MFAENFYTLRKAKGYTQEELAIRFHVVRQTISKWEKGLSVPDADLLAKIADTFEVSANDLLEEKIEAVIESNTMTEQLSRINEQLAISNRRSLRVWRTIAIACMAFILISVIGVVVSNAIHNTRLITSDSVIGNNNYPAITHRNGVTVTDYRYQAVIQSAIDAGVLIHASSADESGAKHYFTISIVEAP